MSRSYKKNPAGGITTARTDRPGKKATHAKYRTAVRCALASGAEPPAEDAVSGPWDWPKDGKSWFGHDTAREQPKLLRK